MHMNWKFDELFVYLLYFLILLDLLLYTYISPLESCTEEVSTSAMR